MNFLELIQKRGGVFVAVSVVSILGVMILPIPPFVLDILLSFSISLSIIILVTGIYIKKPLDFSVFPSMLLITTLYRLALNIASTRLILLRGNEGVDAAGEVIKSFGNFVVGGNYAVGFVVFLILVIVNFVVITKGSGRIAEVAARFTLDAMPGKQMAIDADLNAGLLDESEARKRRTVVSQEADFYGAMDGASKFVRGDAIAGLIITGINIIGGFIIGTLQEGMPLLEAAKTYTILTIGDGLVSQIPALLGLPHISFLLLATISGALAYVLSKNAVEVEKEQEIKPMAQEPAIDTVIEIEPLTFEIGYGLIPLLEGGKVDLLNKIKAMRRQLASELGFIAPSIHIKDNLQIRPHEYSLLIRGIEIARGEVMIGHCLAVASGEAEEIEGIPTKEPAFGLPAFWISDKDMDKAQTKGYMVIDPPTVITTHLTELIKTHAWELLTRTEVQSLLDNLLKNYPKIVDELIPSLLTLGGVQRVLQNLLREKVPINDLVTIFETLIDWAPSTKDTELLTEYVRQSLSRYITKQYISPDGNIYVITLDPEFERAISHAVEAGGAISPEIVNKLMRSIETAITEGRFKGPQPIILCSTQARRFLRKIIERFIPSLVILSNAEISPSVKLSTTGVLRYED
ncbi:MAG: flagellar biosynthesis protein FlhA [bacterium]|nr:MAG: flagellar biosynthesis protein FlhA [bacterium]